MGVWEGDTRENELFHIYGVLIFLFFLGGGGGVEVNLIPCLKLKRKRCYEAEIYTKSMLRHG